MPPERALEKTNFGGEVLVTHGASYSPCEVKWYRTPWPSCFSGLSLRLPEEDLGAGAVPRVLGGMRTAKVHGNGVQSFEQWNWTIRLAQGSFTLKVHVQEPFPVPSS